MLDTFRPLLDAIAGVDLDHAEAAEALLNDRFLPAGPAADALHVELKQLLAQERIAHKGELPVRWSRVSGAEDASGRFSIDVVHMSGAGPRHRHPTGEIDYCIPLSGTPSFDGRPPGWVVFPRDSVHVPTVAGGEMLIVYFLPEGEIEFLKS